MTRISLTPGDNAAECVLKCDWLSFGKSHVDWSIQTIYLFIFPPFFNALCARVCTCRARVDQSQSSPVSLVTGLNLRSNLSGSHTFSLTVTAEIGPDKGLIQTMTSLCSSGQILAVTLIGC